MADQDIVEAARALKAAHIRADVLGGEHGATLARAYDQLLAAVGDVEEPADVAAYRAEVQQSQTAATGSIQQVSVNVSQEQSASSGGGN